MRSDQRANDALRPLTVTPHFVSSADGSVLIECGNTRVICNATFQEVPKWMVGRGSGWVTAEYSLLPQSTNERVQRERKSVSGRTQEIQRLIGRSLRAGTDLHALGENAIIVDCDVIEADGGTRTTSIVGAFIAMGLALQKRKDNLEIQGQVLKHYVTATSVGIVEGSPVLDLCYVEDSSADVDMNVVMIDAQDYAEVQGTGEGATFNRKDLDDLLALALKGCQDLMALQKQFIPALL